MSVSKARVLDFLDSVAAEHRTAPPRIGGRTMVNCKKNMARLPLGHPIRRDVLAHHLAHFLQRHYEEKTRREKNLPVTRGADTHGQAFNTWLLYSRNLVVTELGPGDGVMG